MIYIKINEALERMGKTAYWLAMETGINHTTLSQIRHNQNKAINIEYFEKICKALGCEPGELLEIRPDPSTKKRAK